MSVDEYLRQFQQQQQDIHRRSLEAMSDLAAKNAELIAANGLLQVQSNKLMQAMLAERVLPHEPNEPAGDGGTADAGN